MDSLSKKERPDRSKIHMHQPHEVGPRVQRSREDLQRAVDWVGDSAAAVRKELRAHNR